MSIYQMLVTDTNVDKKEGQKIKQSISYRTKKERTTFPKSKGQSILH